MPTFWQKHHKETVESRCWGTQDVHGLCHQELFCSCHSIVHVQLISAAPYYTPHHIRYQQPDTCRSCGWLQIEYKTMTFTCKHPTYLYTTWQLLVKSNYSKATGLFTFCIYKYRPGYSISFNSHKSHVLVQSAVACSSHVQSDSCAPTNTNSRFQQ